MKSFFLIVALSMLVVVSNANDIASRFSAMEQKADAIEKVRRTRAEVENSPEVLAKTGGFVDVDAKGVAVVVIDARENAGGAPAQFAEVFSNLSKMHVLTENASLAPSRSAFEEARDVLKKHNAVFALIVYDGAHISSGLAVFPEDRVVVINASRYQEGDDPIQREVRIVKELWRGLGYVSGIGYPNYKNDVFQPICSVSELDDLEYQVMQPMNFQKMYTFMRSRGITRARHVPYRVACNEGWASSPTNDYQKAVWEQVKAEKNRSPANPIKVKYDPKTAPKATK